MIVSVAIVLIGFTWRLMRRAITKCLYIVFKLTGLTRLHDHLWNRHLDMIEGHEQRRQHGLRDQQLDDVEFHKPATSFVLRWPISLVVDIYKSVLSYKKLSNYDHDNDDDNITTATRRPIECGQLRRRSVVGQSMVNLPLAANWCAGLRSSTRLNGREALLRQSGNILRRDCAISYDGNGGPTRTNYTLNYNFARQEQHHLHLA